MREIKMVTKEECEREGKIFVGSHRLKDGTFVHSYCKERVPQLRSDRNNDNTELKWTTSSDLGGVLHIAHSDSNSKGIIVVKTYGRKTMWWVEYSNGNIVDGSANSFREAKREVERRMRD